MSATDSYLNKRALKCGLATAAAGVFLCAASPARADMPRDQQERSFYLSITGLRDRISNLDFRLASNASGGKGVRLEFDRGGEASYQVGWLLPDRLGAVGLTYWEFADTQGIGERNSSFVPSDFLNAVTPRVAVSAGAKVLARSVDATYRRDFNADHSDFRASWNLGLRYFRYEHRMEVAYMQSAIQVGDIALEEVESLGVGPRAGASFQYYWGRRWSLSGGLGVATLFGTTDHRNFSRTNIPGGGVDTIREQRGQSRTFSQVDLDMHVVFAARRGLDVTGGYRVAHWFDARTRSRFSNQFEVERVTFDGPYLSVGYRF